MSLTALAPTSPVTTLAAASGGEGYEPPTPAIFWQPVFEIGGLTVTNQMLWAAVVTAALSILCLVVAKRAAVVPSKGQWLFEAVYNLPRNVVGRDMIGTKEFKRFIPLLVTLFLMVLLYNLMGIFPFAMNPVSGKVAFPIALALVVYVVYHAIGFSRHGFVGYFKHMVPGGLPKGVIPVIFPLELLTYFITRPLTLALRLFGNMFAGHLLIYLFVTAGAYFLFDADGILMRFFSLPTFFMAGVMFVFEALIQFLQAFVFVLLTASYIGGALAEDH